LKVLESIKWHLWHGNTYEAPKHLDLFEMDLDGVSEENKVISEDDFTHRKQALS